MQLTVELEEFWVKGRCDGLIVRVMLLEWIRKSEISINWDFTHVGLKIWMRKSIFDCDALLRIESLDRMRHKRVVYIYQIQNIPKFLSESQPQGDWHSERGWQMVSSS